MRTITKILLNLVVENRKWGISGFLGHEPFVRGWIFHYNPREMVEYLQNKETEGSL